MSEIVFVDLVKVIPLYLNEASEAAWMFDIPPFVVVVAPVSFVSKVPVKLAMLIGPVVPAFGVKTRLYVPKSFLITLAFTLALAVGSLLIIVAKSLRDVVALY